MELKLFQVLFVCVACFVSVSGAEIINSSRSDNLRNVVDRRLQPHETYLVAELFTNDQVNFKPSQIDFPSLTHLLYGHFAVKENCNITARNGGWLDFSKVFYEMGMGWNIYDGKFGLVGALQLVQNWLTLYLLPEFKLIASIGGPYAENFRECIEEENRDFFVSSIVDFVSAKQFDGVNIDWEWDIPDIENYKAFVELLAARIKEKNPILETSIVHGMDPRTVVPGKEPLRDLCDPLDYIFLKTYDYMIATNTYDFTGFSAPLRPPVEGDQKNVAWGVEQLLDAGWTSEKLVLGIAAHGICWSGVTAQTDGLREPAYSFCQGTHEPGKVSFYEMETDKYAKEFVKYDEKAMSPYWYNDNVFVSFDSEQSVIEKAKFCKEKMLKGIMIVDAVDDKKLNYESVNFKDSCTQRLTTIFRDMLGCPRYSLLSAAVNELHSGMS